MYLMLRFLFVNDISLAGWKITSKIITCLEYYHTCLLGKIEYLRELKIGSKYCTY